MNQDHAHYSFSICKFNPRITPDGSFQVLLGVVSRLTALLTLHGHVTNVNA